MTRATSRIRLRGIGRAAASQTPAYLRVLRESPFLICVKTFFLAAALRRP
jgi:hypothetical protein